MMADLSSDAIRRSEGKEHSRNSAVLRYTVSGSKEFNDMQLWLVTLVDWTMMSGFPVEPGTPPKLIAFPALQRPRSRGRLTLRSELLTTSRISNSTIWPTRTTCAV
jgi:hypothetical protein